MAMPWRLLRAGAYDLVTISYLIGVLHTTLLFLNGKVAGEMQDAGRDYDEVVGEVFKHFVGRSEADKARGGERAGLEEAAVQRGLGQRGAHLAGDAAGGARLLSGSGGRGQCGQVAARPGREAGREGLAEGADAPPHEVRRHDREGRGE
mmetsp:Transcript_112168/g.311711  ORF Transcript_112168/g.311711 Transcript_112168/m.311711 type:complete len:149 (+) Transcript_112168:109-555(+)